MESIKDVENEIRFCFETLKVSKYKTLLKRYLRVNAGEKFIGRNSGDDPCGFLEFSGFVVYPMIVKPAGATVQFWQMDKFTAIPVHGTYDPPNDDYVEVDQFPNASQVAKRLVMMYLENELEMAYESRAAHEAHEEFKENFTERLEQ